MLLADDLPAEGIQAEVGRDRPPEVLRLALSADRAPPSLPERVALGLETEVGLERIYHFEKPRFVLFVPILHSFPDLVPIGGGISEQMILLNGAQVLPLDLVLKLDVVLPNRVPRPPGQVQLLPHHAPEVGRAALRSGRDSGRLILSFVVWGSNQVFHPVSLHGSIGRSAFHHTCLCRDAGVVADLVLHLGNRLKQAVLLFVEPARLGLAGGITRFRCALWLACRCQHLRTHIRGPFHAVHPSAWRGNGHRSAVRDVRDALGRRLRLHLLHAAVGWWLGQHCFGGSWRFLRVWRVWLGLCAGLKRLQSGRFRHATGLLFTGHLLGSCGWTLKILGRSREDPARDGRRDSAALLLFGLQKRKRRALFF
mmetsp:Transcript_13540/g.50381  ORF Transcript_13540/g.50381 Transcript_13540/m.50381 type:complete len:367 (-) Transcript_13540:72-1172(-)